MNEILDIDSFNKAANDLTNLSTEKDGPGFKLVNLHVLACYNSSIVKKFSQLAIVAFNFLIRNKFYGKDANERKEGIDEEKRIYTDRKINLEDILRECDNSKYADEKAVALEASNTNKRLKELDESNMFYLWRYKGLYQFILERDVRMWKAYNSKACVIPKTMKKIVALSSDMITCMERNSVTEYKRAADKNKIEKSFGYFINGMIDKMNPIVALGVAKWNGKDDVVGTYLVQLSQQLSQIPDEEAIAIDGNIFNLLPRSVSDKLFVKQREDMDMKKKKVENNVQTNLEKDIIPTDANLVRPRRAKRHKVDPPSEKVKEYSYDGVVNPFEDAPSFMNYYTAFLQYRNNKTRFEAFEIDVRDALEVLDLMAAKGHSKGDSPDKAFLNGWLNYFCINKLKGDNVLKAKYTSVKRFKETLNEFVKCGAANLANIV